MPQQNYIDGYPGDAVAISQAPRQYPLRKYGNVTHAVYTRKYQQALASFVPSPIGMEDPLASGFYLTDESVPEIDQGIMAEFTRTFSNIPASHVTYSQGTITRPASLISFSGAVREVGSEANSDAGLVVRKSTGSQSFDLYTRHVVTADAGASSIPTGGTFTITLAGFGTTSALAYNASAATVLTALQALSGYDANYHVFESTSASNNDRRVTFSRVYPTLRTGTGAGMVLSNYSFQTPFVDQPYSVGWAPGGEWRSGSKTQAELEALGWVLTADSNAAFIWDTPSDFSFVLPTYNTTGDTSTYANSIGANTYYQPTPYNKKVRITGYVSTIDVDFPSDIDDQAQRIAFRDAFLSAWMTAQGFTSLNNPIVGAGNVAELRHGIDGQAGTSERIVYSKSIYGQAFLNPRSIAANAPGGWSATFGWSGVTVTVNASTTKSSLQTAVNALAPVSSGKVPVTIDSVTQDYRGVVIVISSNSPNAFSATSSLTPAPSSIEQQLSTFWSNSSMRMLFTANVTDRTLTFTYPHQFTEGQLLYVKQGSTYQYGNLPFTVTGDYTISVSNTDSRWSAAVAEVGGYINSYKAGAASVVVRETVDYFGIGASHAYSDPSQIPVFTGAFDDNQYISALFNPLVSYVPNEASKLEEYLPGIWKRINYEVKIK